jgi:hypothetical protein
LSSLPQVEILPSSVLGALGILALLALILQTGRLDNRVRKQEIQFNSRFLLVNLLPFAVSLWLRPKAALGNPWFNLFFEYERDKPRISRMGPARASPATQTNRKGAKGPKGAKKRIQD